MPDMWTHYFFAKEVLLENKLKNIDEEAYFLGAQGPDILFYLNFEPWKKPHECKDLGHLFHAEETKQLIEDVRMLQTNSEGVLRSYLTGFLAHYALDSMEHAFIRMKAEGEIAHKILEANIDIRFHSERRSGNIQAEKPWKLMQIRGDFEPIDRFYQTEARKLYGKDMKTGVAEEGYRSFMRFLRLSRGGGPIRRNIKGALINLAGEKLDRFFYQSTYDPKVINDKDYSDFKHSYERAKNYFNQLMSGTASIKKNFEGDFLIGGANDTDRSNESE